MRFVLAFISTIFVCCYGERSVAQTDRPNASRSAYLAALANPDDKAALTAFLATLPRTTSLFTGEVLYLLEGDLARTEPQVKAYLRARKGPPPNEPVTELKLHTTHGMPMCWSIPAYRKLRYAIWKPSFDEQLKDNSAAYQKMVPVVREATSDWEQACPECGITFEHVTQLDTVSKDDLFDALQDDRIRFFVYYQPGTGGILARAFFPGDPIDRRTLQVGDGVISRLGKTPAPTDRLKYTVRGILRHELGHVLGYRHEHIDTPNENCRAEPDLINTPTNITPLDGASVMHYDCGRPEKPVGADDLISPTDIAGHRLIYGPQKPGHICGVPIAGAASIR
jgi:hypothetical protein